ncbi:MAG: hypothetical protein KatS3mg002_0377 [Candidatus Woesearchaeota archaeon]|nr:MAG: hypothetical protein KatS3mg002_0377 [Candidatus Woesearchaeota archaeon]
MKTCVSRVRHFFKEDGYRPKRTIYVEIGDRYALFTVAYVSKNEKNPSRKKGRRITSLVRALALKATMNHYLVDSHICINYVIIGEEKFVTSMFIKKFNKRTIGLFIQKLYNISDMNFAGWVEIEFIRRGLIKDRKACKVKLYPNTKWVRVTYPKHENVDEYVKKLFHVYHEIRELPF